MVENIAPRKGILDMIPGASIIERIPGWNISKIGSLKFYSERSRQWVNWLQFLMIAYMTIVTTDFNMFLMLLALLGLMVWTLIDAIIIYPREVHLNYQMNPSWQKIENDLAEIKRVLNELTK